MIADEVYKMLLETNRAATPEANDNKLKVRHESFDRANLPDSEFGIPSERKYPIHDKKHVISAIKMFNYVDAKDEKLLADNIIKKINKFGMTDLDKYILISNKNRFSKYWKKKEKVVSETMYNAVVLKPIYIVTVYTGTAMGKAIKAFTHSTYSHAALGLDHALDKLYSFNAKSKSGKLGKGGLSIESLNEYVSQNNDADMQVTTVFLKDKDYNVLKEKLDWFEEHISDTTYDVANLFNIVFNKVKKTSNQLSMVCSEFVEYLFNIINVDLSGKATNLTTPDDLSKIKNPKAYKIFEGKAKDYKAKTIEKKIQRMIDTAKPIKENAVLSLLVSKDSALLETKEFPVNFTHDGDLIIKNYRTLNHESEYYKSVKLLKTYKDTGNIEGMKYELSKLWFISEVLIRKINSTRTSLEDRRKYLDLKKKVLNTFSQYLKIVSSMENDFNFVKYYEDTPFSDTKIKIDGATLRMGVKLLKSVL